ncbi:hypothetical protein P691DRAFT_730571 [Macrolepiota fuliginosa MF-IS2]|uniref:Integral membrane protein n=1 Tax=Macrolepiota fuliginosa MF-IS2 TaxID=1400762 RepID=A0A9P5XC07_9AGAR|nr:hypothetical protein P691DRAFT_730571 [Macrolepiota fuliginosa MF-IS2]
MNVRCLTWKSVAFYIIHAFAIPACVVRLFYRQRTGRLWWDDFWAFVALLFDCGMVAVSYTNMTSSIRWATVITFSSTLWGARLCIAVTIVRLVPPGRGRLVAKGVSILFGMIWAALIIQKCFLCGGYNLNIATCGVPRTTGILELCTDLVADAWLIFSPAYLLWDAKLAHRRQVLIYSVFASDILLSVLSIIHGAFILHRKGAWVGLVAHVEAATSLLLCNLLVLATWIYSRICLPDESDDISDSSAYTTQAPRRPNGPIYGFDGSALILTEISSSDDPPSKPNARSNQSERFGRSFNALYTVQPSGFGCPPFHLRRVQSCPAIVNLHMIPMLKGPNETYNMGWKNIADTDTIPSMMSSGTGNWSSLRNGWRIQRGR